jgi:cofilin
MPSTGIAINDDCMQVIKSLKTSKYRYVIFSIKPTTGSKQEIQVEKVGEHDSSHEEFLQQFPVNDNRYALINITFEMPSSTEGLNEGVRSKSIFIAWNTESSSVKSRFTYAASRKSLKQALQGTGIEVQAGTLDSLSMEALIEKCLTVTK